MDTSLLDSGLLPAVIVREGRLVYANEAACRLVGTPRERLIGRTWAEFVVPEDHERVAYRHERRLRGAVVPGRYEATLVGADGGRVPVTVFASASDPDTLVHLVEPWDLTGSDRLKELAELGAALQLDRSEEDIVGRVQKGLMALGLASAMGIVRNGHMAMQFMHVPGDVLARLGSDAAPVVGIERPLTPLLQEVLRTGAVFSDEWAMETQRFFGSPLGEAWHRALATEGLTRGIGFRLDVGGEAHAIVVAAGTRWPGPEDVPAFRLFALQVSAALDAANRIESLTARNAELAALNRLAAIAGSETDLAQFLQAAAGEVRETARCDGLAIYLVAEGSAFAELAYDVGGSSMGALALRRIPLEPPAIAAVLAGSTRVAQLVELPEPFRNPLREMGFETIVMVPLRVRSTGVGILMATYRTRRVAAACPTALLEAMGAHFASAVEAQRLLADLRRRVSELTLLNDVAVGSATLDPMLLLDNAVRRIVATFDADTGVAHVVEGDQLVIRAQHGFSPETARILSTLRIGQGLPGDAVRRCAPVSMARTADATGRARWLRAREGVETGVAVPLVVKGRAVGVLTIGRRFERPFNDGEIALLSAIGVQLAVALESARLFANTRRRLSDLEAVNAFAVRMFGTSPGDRDALLHAVCQEAAQALSVRSAVVLLLDASGSKLEGAASWGTPLAARDLAIRLDESGFARGVVSEQQPATSPDISAETPGDTSRPGHPRISLLMVPLASRRATLGVLAIGDPPGRRFDEGEIALASALARVAAVGIENAELYREERRRVEEMSLIHEVGRTIAVSLDLERVLQEGAGAVRRLVDATHCLVLLHDAGRGELRLGAVVGDIPSELRSLRQSVDHRSAATAALRDRRPVVVEDAATHAAVSPWLQQRLGVRSLLAVPLLLRDATLGVVLALECRASRRYTQIEVDRVMGIASQLAVAVENARLYDDLRRSYADLERAQRQLVHRERLAALGELAAVVAHEVRNPLGVIFNSLGSLRRLLRPSGDAKMLLDIVGEESERLNRIVGDLLDFAKPSMPVLHPERLERVVDEALAAALPGGTSPVVVERQIEPSLPLVPMDARMMRQALLNVAVNAVQAMPRGGTLSVRARRAGEGIEVEIADTGPGIPHEVRDRIFEPFFTTKASGTGLGLAVVKRIIEGHRGEVSVESHPGAGTTFRMRLPLESAAVPRTVEG